MKATLYKAAGNTIGYPGQIIGFTGRKIGTGVILTAAFVTKHSATLETKSKDFREGMLEKARIAELNKTSLTLEEEQQEYMKVLANIEKQAEEAKALHAEKVAHIEKQAAERQSKLEAKKALAPLPGEGLPPSTRTETQADAIAAAEAEQAKPPVVPAEHPVQPESQHMHIDIDEPQGGMTAQPA